MKQTAWRILWPSFLAAGVLDAMVFALVDPVSLRWLGGPLIDWPAPAVYAVAFLIFWFSTAMAGAMALLVPFRADDVKRFGVDAGQVVETESNSLFDTSVRPKL